MIVVGGGDGTISAAASALAGPRPCSASCRLERSTISRATSTSPPILPKPRSWSQSGPQRRVDVAEMNGRVFINNSAIGLYPLMVVDRDAQRERLGRSKRLAMLVASIRTLFRFKHQRLTLTVNDEQARVDTPLLFVGNNDYRVDIGARRTAREPRRWAALRPGDAQESRRGSSPQAFAPCSIGRAATIWCSWKRSSGCASTAGAETLPFQSTEKSFAPHPRWTIEFASRRCG